MGAGQKGQIGRGPDRATGTMSPMAGRRKQAQGDLSSPRPKQTKPVLRDKLTKIRAGGEMAA